MLDSEPRVAPFVLSRFFPYKVRVFYTAVTGAVRQLYMERHGLAVNEWRALVVLNEHEPLSATGIVDRSSMDKVSVSRAVATLEKRGLMERHVDPADRRRVLLRLTRAGRALVDDIVPLVTEVERDMLSVLTPEERTTLESLMEKVAAKARTIGPPSEDDHG
jgi:DNA-binding MarR family transcriptional regulator